MTLAALGLLGCPQVPSLLDPSLAPEGYHVIHSYTAGNEPYEVWEKFEERPRTDPEYVKLKEERAAPMWEAIRRTSPRNGSVAVVQRWCNGGVTVV